MSGESDAESAVSALLSCSVILPFLLCATMLRRDYPRLARPSLELQAEETLWGGGLLRPLGRSFRVKLWPTLVIMRGGRVVRQVFRPDVGEVREALAEIAEA